MEHSDALRKATRQGNIDLCLYLKLHQGPPVTSFVWMGYLTIMTKKNKGSLSHQSPEAGTAVRKREAGILLRLFLFLKVGVELDSNDFIQESLRFGELPAAGTNSHVYSDCIAHKCSSFSFPAVLPPSFSVPSIKVFKGLCPIWVTGQLLPQN